MCKGSSGTFLKLPCIVPPSSGLILGVVSLLMKQSRIPTTVRGRSSRLHRGARGGDHGGPARQVMVQSAALLTPAFRLGWLV
jgi:hypothetical protein